MNPFIVLQDATGVTEAGFAGERNDDRLVRMIGTGVFGITEFIRVAADEHFVDGLQGIFRDLVSMFGVNRVPVILKDLADGDFTS